MKLVYSALPWISLGFVIFELTSGQTTDPSVTDDVTDDPGDDDGTDSTDNSSDYTGLSGQSAAYDLYHHLINSTYYDKRVRPVDGYLSPVDVFVTYRLLSLVEMDEKAQTIIMTADLVLDWFDNYLKWIPARFGDIDTMLATQEEVWIPDVIVANSVQPRSMLGYRQMPVRLYSYGQVIWAPSVMTETSCDIIVTYYPFDTQICEIEFSTAMSFSSEVYMYVDKEYPIDMGDFNQDGSWLLTAYAAENLGLEDGDMRPKIRFTFLLERRTRFYVVSIILPVMLLSLTASLVFALPAESGEKMGTGITVLLAYAVYLTIISEYLPDTSLQTSVLALYLTLLLGYTALSVLVSTFILRVHHMPTDEPVGQKITSMTLFLMKIFCIRRKSFKKYTPDAPANQEASPDYAHDDNYRGNTKNGNGVDNLPYTNAAAMIRGQVPRVRTSHRGHGGHRRNNSNPEDLHLTNLRSPSNGFASNGYQIYNGRETSVTGSNQGERHPNSGRNHDNGPASPPMYRKPIEWKDVAKAIDWVFFVLFTTATVVTTVVCLLVLILGGYSNKPSISHIANYTVYTNDD